MRLSAVEGRVIGSLIEKQLTTPQQYPLTLNALLSACNQSSNRDPVVSYEAPVVEGALASLKESRLLRFVHPSHGRSVIRYRQVLEERLGLDERGLALVAVLLLRGPQTAAELRARTERMADFGGPSGVDAELERMTEGDEPLVARLARRPGQKEERWVQLLADEPPAWGETRSGQPPAGPAWSRPSESGVGPATPDGAGGDARRVIVDGRRDDRPGAGADRPGGPPDHADELAGLRREMTDLRADVSGLRAEVAALATALDELRGQLGG